MVDIGTGIKGVGFENQEDSKFRRLLNGKQKKIIYNDIIPAENSGSEGDIVLSQFNGEYRIYCKTNAGWTYAKLKSLTGELREDLVLKEVNSGIVHKKRGEVTQITNLNTGVTVHSTAGIIELDNTGLTEATKADFKVTNQLVKSSSLILLTVQCPSASAATDNSTMVAQLDAVSDGYFNIRLTNPAAATTTTGVHKIHFLVINNS